MPGKECEQAVFRTAASIQPQQRLRAAGWFTISYTGKQPAYSCSAGIRPVFVSNVFSYNLPNVPSQNYYFGDLTLGSTWYVRAFVDVDASGAKAATSNWKMASYNNFGGFLRLINVTGVMTGKNVTLSVDVSSPGAPFNLGRLANHQITLNWAPAVYNADGTTLIDAWGYEVERSTAGGRYVLVSDTNTPVQPFTIAFSESIRSA